MNVIESAKKYCQEKHESVMMEERSLAKAMRQKLMIKKMKERKARLQQSEETIQPKGFIIVDD